MGRKRTTKWQGKFKIGQTFGYWTVVDDYVIVEREAKVKCKCECGTEKYVTALTLVRGLSKKCSNCGNSGESHAGPNNGNWKGEGKVPGYYLNRKKIDIATRIEAAKLIEKQNFTCNLTKLPISFVDKTASLDRIDSTKPYAPKNIQWVHKDINVMKNAYPLEYFVAMCKLVTENCGNLDKNKIQNTFVFGTKQ